MNGDRKPTAVPVVTVLIVPDTSLAADPSVEATVVFGTYSGRNASHR